MKLKELVIIILLSIGVVIFMFPFYWMVVESLKAPGEFMKMPPRLFPTNPRFENYAEAVKYIPFFRYLWNTVFVAVMSTLGMVLSSSYVAYGFAKIKWPGRELLFTISLSTMMIPFMVTMIPLYIEFKKFGWLGSLKPLWVPAWFANAWNIFFIRQFYRGIPDELIDAARVDGASHFQIWLKIVIPLSKPVLAVAALFHFVYSWKDFLGPLIFLTDQKLYTLSLGLSFFQSQHGGTEWQYLMAAATLTTIPTIIIFFLANKYLIRGIHITSGLKH